MLNKKLLSWNNFQVQVVSFKGLCTLALHLSMDDIKIANFPQLRLIWVQNWNARLVIQNCKDYPAFIVLFMLLGPSPTPRSYKQYRNKINFKWCARKTYLSSFTYDVLEANGPPSAMLLDMSSLYILFKYMTNKSK